MSDDATSPPEGGTSENLDRQTIQTETGARRSALGEHLDFTSLPILGLIGVARTAKEGLTKHGRFNYLRGFPAHQLANRALRHLLLWCAGDRSEPHLSHAAWNAMAADQSMILSPELNAPHNPGPGFTLTPEMQAFLEAGDAERARKRAAGELAKEGDWRLEDLPEILAILADRERGKAAARAAPGPEAATSPQGETSPTGSGEQPKWRRTPPGFLRHRSGYLIVHYPGMCCYRVLDSTGESQVIATDFPSEISAAAWVCELANDLESLPTGHLP